MYVCDHRILTTRCPHGKLDPYLTPYVKNNPKWIKDINAGNKSLKFLKENERKSIPLNYFEEHAYLIEEKFIPRLDYLKIIDEVLGGV